MTADLILADMRKNKRQATKEEQVMIDEVEDARNEIIQVDAFEKLGKERHMGKEYIRPALQDYMATKGI